MFTREDVLHLLASVREGHTTIEQGLEELRDLPYVDLAHTTLDMHRALRNGFPEVIYAEGKSAAQVQDIFTRMSGVANVLATRVSAEMAAKVQSACPQTVYNGVARTLSAIHRDLPRRSGRIVIVTAGTSDLPVAEEAQVTCEMMGLEAKVVSDVGVAGVHRLFLRLDEIRQASVIIVVAGMEGALPSIVGGLVDQPIIAVPTSVGYGVQFSGLSALFCMLTSCASGLTVVNIDNGFGAACAAARICGMGSR